MRIQFSDGTTVQVEDTGLTLEFEVEEQFVAPLGRCYLLSDNGSVITDTHISRELIVAAGVYTMGRRKALGSL